MAANTYSLISKKEITGSNVASVTFSSIPQTYLDLVFRVSLIGAGGSSLGAQVTFNSDTGANYSYAYAFSQNGAVQPLVNNTPTNYGVFPAGYTVTSSTPGYFEMYVPSYTSTFTKQMGGSFGLEDWSSSAAYVGYASSMWNSTSPITSVTFSLNTISTTSVFSLYGIKNS